MSLKTLGVCGGNGVILHPFRNQLVGNIEPRTVFHTTHQKQWNLNFNVSYDETTDVRYRKDGVDIIIGAPDCGHSSVLAYSRAKKMSDPSENASLRAFVDSINYYQPQFFMMENLPKMLEHYPTLLDEFLNYRTVTFKESVSAWGNSQKTRVRLVIVGVHKDLPKNTIKKFKLPKTDFIYKTSGELIKGLEEYNPSICHVTEDDKKMINLYYGDDSRVSVKKARKLWLTEFKAENRWPVNRERMKNQPGVYRNFANAYPFTVRKANRQFNHWGHMLSPREMARIQGVPDSFKLWYDEDWSEYCINKARTTVTKSPPYEIGVWFKSIIDKLNF